MKLQHLLLCLLGGGMLSAYTGISKPVRITGQLENVDDGVIITLWEDENRVLEVLANDTVLNGQFSFILPDSFLRKTATLELGAVGKGLSSERLILWVSPGDEVKITGKDKVVASWRAVSDNPLQKEQNTYEDKIKDYKYKSEVAMLQANAYADSIKKMPGRRAEFKTRVDSLKAIRNSMSSLIWGVENELMEEQKTYSDLWMNKLNRFAMLFRFRPGTTAYREKIQALYDGIPDERKKSKLGESIYTSLNLPKAVGVGDDMADVDMWDLEGNLHRLENYKGKYILITFWSSGCHFCVSAIPEMREVSEEYKDKLTIVSISSDEKELWAKTSKEKNITWVNLNDLKGHDGIKVHYRVRRDPSYFIISPEGKIIGTWTGYRKGYFREKVAEFLK